MRDWTVKGKLEEAEITKSKFADDAAMCAVTRQVMERVAVTFVTTATGRWLTVCLQKTKMMSLWCPKDNVLIQLE